MCVCLRVYVCVQNLFKVLKQTLDKLLIQFSSSLFCELGKHFYLKTDSNLQIFCKIGVLLKFLKIQRKPAVLESLFDKVAACCRPGGLRLY